MLQNQYTMKFRQFLLDRTIDSTALFLLTHQFAYEEGTCLLYSGSSYETAKQSFLFLFPYESITIGAEEKNPWEALKKAGCGTSTNGSSFPEWVGFLGYEMGAPHMLASTPKAYWQRCAVTLRVDHQTGAAEVRVIEDETFLINNSNKDWLKRLSTQEGWKKLLQTEPPAAKTNEKLVLTSISDSQASYINKIEQTKEFIRKGDVYQINLSQQWEFLGQRDPFILFKQLSLLNPAPFSAYFYLKDFAIISSSPERFLQKEGQVLETRPIKGTAPRGKTQAEDTLNKDTLKASVKERAELMMITDLMRNDLGKVSEIGSVEVPLLCACEAYQNVFHLYSVVRSQALSSIAPIDIVRACFPGGSITGCPKLRAMEVIAELESRPRGIYTGSIGYFTGNGDFDFNIAIRTVVLEKHCISTTYSENTSKINIQLGGAIVIDSNPVKEYEETHHKGESIFKILNL